MKRKTCGMIRCCAFAYAVLILYGQFLKADAPPAEAGQRQLELTTPVKISGVEEENVTLSEVLLQVAGQTDSVLGINVKPVDDVLRSHLGLAEGKGFVVTAVADDSAAANAGIQKNDVLLTVAGDEISSLDMLSKRLREAPHQTFSLGIMRAGKKEAVEIKAGSLEVAELHRVIKQHDNEPKYRIGVGLADADETLRSQLSLLGGEGLVVTSVENESPAAKAGVLVNDVLIKLDDKALTSIDALSAQLQTIGDKAVSLELLRRGQPATLTVTPEKRAAAEVRLWLEGTRLTPEHIPLTIFASQPDLDLAFSLPALNEVKPDLSKQVSDLLQQVKQLQTSLETLQAALKADPEPAGAGEKK